MSHTSFFGHVVCWVHGNATVPLTHDQVEGMSVWLDRVNSVYWPFVYVVYTLRSVQSVCLYAALLWRVAQP